jgi:dTDP-glucose 4,6-dehydratase
VQVSTDEVYGSLGADGKFTEDTPLDPRSPYSASKAAADCLVQSYFHTYGLDTVITRCSNNYGPYQFPEKLIPLMIINILNGKKLPVYGDGLNIRDWIHVEDHCRGIELASISGKAGEVYNFGGESEKTNIQIVQSLLDELGADKSLITYVKDRLGHDKRYAIDNTKSKSELGFKPTIDFESGIKNTVQWYLDNKDWWEKIISGEYKEYYRKHYYDR